MTKVEPHITVVVPCYNRAESVHAAIGSILTQNYPSFDVVAVDDGSEDGTGDVLRAINDPRLRVIDNPGPKGVSGARNAGTTLARGPWIAFQDSDDLWRPEKLKRQMERVSATANCVAVYCAMEIVEGEGASRHRIDRVPKPGARHTEGDIRPGLALNSLVSTQTVVIRRDVFEATSGFDPAFNALVDWELMIRVAEHGNVAFVDEELVEQRMSSNSITRSAERRLAAQEQILSKHGAFLARYPAALAKHHYRIAGAHRAFGNLEEARHHLRLARAISPLVPRYHLALIHLTLFGRTLSRA